jgi:hypothetical protein
MLSPGAIAGIVIGSVVGLIVFLIVPCWLIYRRQKAQHSAQARLELATGDAISIGPNYHAPALELGQQPSSPYQGYGELGAEPLNFGSMQVKGIRDVRGDRDREGLY